MLLLKNKSLDKYIFFLIILLNSNLKEKLKRKIAVIQSFERSTCSHVKSSVLSCARAKYHLVFFPCYYVWKGNISVPMYFLGRSIFIWSFLIIRSEFSCYFFSHGNIEQVLKTLVLWLATLRVISLISIFVLQHFFQEKEWECFICFWGCKVSSRMKNGSKCNYSTFSTLHLFLTLNNQNKSWLETAPKTLPLSFKSTDWGHSRQCYS